jgi:periplasmic protein CpxP/Spy
MSKKILSLTASALLSIGAAMAMPVPQNEAQPAPSETPQQDSGHGRHRQMDPEKRLAFLTKKLNLTADQQNQIRPILADEQQQMQALRADTSLAREDRFSKMKTIREEGRTKIEAQLNADQKTAFEQMQQQGGMRHHGKTDSGQNEK